MGQYKVGKIVKGNITGIEKYGIFVNLDKLSTLFVGEEYVDDEVISSLKEKGIDVKYNVDELLLESEEI